MGWGGVGWDNNVWLRRAHGLRKLYVGQNKPHFQKEVAAAVTRFQKAKPLKPVPKYRQAHFRVLGLKARSYMGPVAKRGGNIVLKVLPFKLVPPGASPPVESKPEIVQSKIMTFLGDSKKIRLYSDGAKAWESLCEEKRIKSFPVAHRKHQFTRKLKHGRNQEPPLLELKQWTDGGNPLTVSFLRR